MANFTKPMKWNNKGIEPSETLKNQGFKGGYKPPAEVFNYFFNNSEICVDELQKASDEAQSTADSAKAAADKAQSTADSAATATSSAQSTAESAGTAAALAQSTADEAQSTTNSAKAAADKAQSTAEGKADGTHKHKKSDITDFPTSITPTSHASINTTYGAGNSSNYVHVKLSDSTTSTSVASGGVAATPAAVRSVKAIADEAKSTADSAKAEADKAQNTASSAATAASSAQSTAESAGTAAALAQAAADEAQSTANSAKAAADKAQSTAEEKADGTHKHKKSDITDFPTSMTPTSHASASTTYGLGNSSNYGHLKLSDSITSTSGVSSGVAATPSAVRSVKAIADEAKAAANTQYAYGTLHFTTPGGYDATSTYKVINFIPSIIKVYFLGDTSTTQNFRLCTVLTPPTAYDGSSYTPVNTTWRGTEIVDGDIAEVSKGKTYHWRPKGASGYYLYEIMGYKETT